MKGSPPSVGNMPGKPREAEPLPHPGKRDVVKNPPRQPGQLGRTGFGTDQSKPRQSVKGHK